MNNGEIFNLIIVIKTQNLRSKDISKIEQIFVLKRRVEKQHPIFNLTIEIEIQNLYSKNRTNIHITMNNGETASNF